MEKLQITTGTIGKEELFKMMTVAELTGLCLLLVGPPGTAKTKTVLEYAKAVAKKNNASLKDEVFILETDEQTRSSEVKGRFDLEEMMKNSTFKLDSPIAKAKYIVINEIDKASSTVRNSLLGIMNEKIVFNGKEKLKCNWDLFVATCNEIPTDELGSPFWDRFLLKIPVKNLSLTQLKKYFSEGGKEFSKTLKINKPTKEEIASIPFPLDMFMEVVNNLDRNIVSDRTITFLPDLIKTIALVYDINIRQAFIKAIEYVVDLSTANKISNIVIPAVLQSYYKDIESLSAITDSVSLLQSTINNILKNLTTDLESGTISKSDFDEISNILNLQVENLDLDKIVAEEKSKLEKDKEETEVILEDLPF
jgi:hypothetical protein